jgi:hypothetical protein
MLNAEANPMVENQILVDAQNDTRSKYDIFDDVEELVRSGIEAERMELIPVSKIRIDEGLVDEAHRDTLLNSMNEQHQLIPVGLRVRLDDSGEIVYDVIDGFHRTAGLQLKEAETGRLELVKAVVKYGLSDEHMYDLRVMAVNSVKSVSFPRMIMWMNKSFASSEWADKGVSLLQLLTLTYQDNSGAYLNLSKEEVVRAKEWVLSKSKTWTRPLGSIIQDLRAAEVVDPELIKIVRVGSGGEHSKKGFLNPARLKAIADVLPGMYVEQNIAASIICKFDLDSQQSEILARGILNANGDKTVLDMIRNNSEDAIREVYRIKEEIEAEQLETEEPKSENQISVIYPPNNNKLERYRRTVKANGRKKRFSGLEEYKTLTNKESRQIQMENKQLKDQIDQMREAAGSSNTNWFELINGLTTRERSIMTQFFRKFSSVAEIAFEENLTPSQVLLQLQSAHNKYTIQEHERVHKERVSALTRSLVGHKS